MVADSRIVFHQVDKFISHFCRFKRTQPQSFRISSIQNNFHCINKRQITFYLSIFPAFHLIKIFSICSDMNTGQNDFFKIIFEFQTFCTNTIKTSGTNTPANKRNNTIRTEIIATVFNFQKSSCSLRSVRKVFKFRNIFCIINVKNFIRTIF